MNLAEQRAFDVLTPLILGDGPTEITQDMASRLSLFCAIMFSMIDRDALATSAVSQEERSFIYDRQAPPEGWQIFLGKHNASDWSYRFLHHGASVALKELPAAHGAPFNYQICTVGLGKMVLQVSSGVEWARIEDPVGYACASGLTLINPYTAPINISRLPLLTSNDLFAVANGRIEAGIAHTRRRLRGIPNPFG